MQDYGLLINGSPLAKAVHWLSHQHAHDKKTVYAAALRFDLNIKDEQFLIEHFVFDQDVNPMK
ncbi:hypothetical protein DBZ36_13905 [Alginatibacterium sediminis]|uniref:Uncharacterized protein n=1 Tax=Alginatibacterium sediminis TaxID=2164068 RepID=A0A420EA17_9ALTE|nr:hypothetical protein [Alginatibacterium sediminis]RKF17526.1 hypothetical protein DBZ36_13905 [Alginatibacterium sediminis]